MRSAGRLMAAALLAAVVQTIAGAAFLDAVVVDVNGTITTASDVVIARALSLFALTPSDAPIRDDDVQRVVDARLVVDEARRLRITAEPADIDEAWRAAAERLGGMDVLHRWLDQAGLDEGWVRKLLEADLRRRRFIDVRFRPFVFITEEELTQAIGPGPHPPETRGRALNALRDAATTRELTAWLAEARTRATIRSADIGAAGVPLPFAMPARVAP